MAGALPCREDMQDTGKLSDYDLSTVNEYEKVSPKAKAMLPDNQHTR